MDTTLMPLNTAQFTNSIAYIGEWFQPYFNPLITLGLMFAGIYLASLLVRGLIIWLTDGAANILTPIRNKYYPEAGYRPTGKRKEGRISLDDYDE